MSEPNPNRFYKWIVEIEISEVWVADGFEITADDVQEMIQKQIGYSYEHETRVRIVKSPTVEEIRLTQGYTTAVVN